MTIATGRDFLAIPGPTVVPDVVLNSMHRPAVDIYSGGLPEITDNCLDGLKRIIKTEGKTYIYIANGHGAWEAAISNVLSKDETVLVLATGRFAVGWGEMATRLGVNVETIDFGWHNAVDLQKVHDHLAADKQGRIKAVMVVQVDTATGVVNDIPAIRKVIDDTKHDALFMVDTIASLGSLPYYMDDWGVDVTVAAGQKGLMTPPGLSFIAASKKAKAAHQKAGLCTSYWDWTAREGEMHYQKYSGTPPEHLLFGFDKSLELLETEGLEAVWRRHQILADATRAAVECWQRGNVLQFNIHNPEERANSLTVVEFDDSRLDAMMTFCREQCNVTLGVGLAEKEGKSFRIAHMGYVNAPHMLGVLSTIDLALKKCEIPHGEGAIEAAIQAMARHLS